MSGWQWNGLVQTRTVGSPTRKAVLMFLADVADTEGRSYYAVETMAASLELSDRTVRRALDQCETDGLLTRDRRRRADGTLGSYDYWLSWDGLAALPWNGLRRGGLDHDPFGQALPDSDDTRPVRVTASPPVTDARTTGHSDRAEPPVVTPMSEPPAEPSSSPSSDVETLCSQLAERVAQHQRSPRPPITERWRKDMRLLLERGPLHQEQPEAMPAERVAGTIAYIFDSMSDPQGRGGFCWAAQIRSPHALRDHWHQMAAAAERERRAKRGASASAIDRVMSREPASGGTLFDAPPPRSWGARAALGAG